MLLSENREGIQAPPPAMPKIFSVIDSKMNQCFRGARIESVVPELPGGVVEYGEKWVRSKPIAIPNRSSTCFISGKFDTVIKFDDGTYGVVDFKTSERREEHIPLYSRQLHAYAYALENPAPGELSLNPVSKLGLLVFEPDTFTHASAGNASLVGGLSWIEFPRDDGTFLKFLGRVVSVLDQPAPPGGTPSCPWCQYRDTARRTGL